MRAPLTIAVTQPLCHSFEVAANARTHAATIREANARVVVFPELSLTGYEMEAPPLEVEDPRLTLIVEACAETGSLALAGAPVPGEAGQTHIALLAITGSGVAVAYRKMWLGATEAQYFAPGTQSSVLEVDGWRLGLAICKDTGIRQHSAETAGLGMDLYVASVLEFAEDVVIEEERARRVATEHQVWVAVSSFAGSTGGGYHRAAGCSGIWNAAGQEIARVGPEVGAMARATLQ